MLSVESPWACLHPAALRVVLGSLRVPWWVCGGWAIDLFVGQQTRPHDDLDVGCFRQDGAAFRQLVGWTGVGAHHGTLVPLSPHTDIPSRIDSVWFAEETGDAWVFQLMLEERAGDEWLLRRNRIITRAVGDLCWTTDEGVHVLRPEIQLLYKAHRPRPKDVQDLNSTLPMLPEPDRRWLSEGIANLYPGHPWLDHLDGVSAT